MKIRQVHMLAAVVAAFLIVKAAVILTNSVPTQSDASLYIYTAKAVAEGAVPYRDFFFAHPLLMILPTVLLFKVASPSFLLGSVQPIAAGVVILVVTFLAGEKMKKGVGLVASVLLLSSYYFQFGTHWLGGVALNTALLMLAFYFALFSKPFKSGMFLLLSSLVRYSSFPAGIVLTGYHLIKREKKFFLGVAVASSVLVLLLLLPNYISNTFFYHFGKGASIGIGWRGFAIFLKREIILVLLSIVSASYLFMRKRREEPLLLTLALAKSPILLIFLSEVYPWYLFYSLPFLCLTSGFLLEEMYRKRDKVRWAIPLLIAAICFANFLPTYANIQGSGEDFYVSAYERMPIAQGETVFDTLSNMGAHFCLEKGCKIAGDVIDITPVRIASGAADMPEIVSRVSSDSPRYILDMRGGAGGNPVSWDHVWRKTELRAFVYENYQPQLLIYNQQNFLLTVVWARPEPGGLELAGASAVYDVNYLAAYAARGNSLELDYGQAQRASEKGDVFFSQGLSEQVREMNPDKLEIPAGIWESLSSYSKDESGAYTIETWANGKRGLVFTEVSLPTHTVALVVMQYSEELGTWNSLTIYQNILGGFVPVYEERLAYTVA